MSFGCFIRGQHYCLRNLGKQQWKIQAVSCQTALSKAFTAKHVKANKNIKELLAIGSFSNVSVCYLIKERTKQRSGQVFFYKMHLDTEEEHLLCDVSCILMMHELLFFLLWLWFILSLKSRVNTLHSLFLLKAALKLAVKQDGNYQSKTWNHKNSSKKLQAFVCFGISVFLVQWDFIVLSQLAHLKSFSR